MSGKFFIDALSEETIIELTGEMLKEENMNKNLSKPRLGDALLKIIPAAAMVALIIGAINILPAILNNENGPPSGSLAPGAYANNYDGEEIDLFVPWAAEKDFFDKEVLAVMPTDRERDKMLAYYTRDKMLAYYTLIDPTQYSLQEYIFMHPLNFYITHEIYDITADEVEEFLMAYTRQFEAGIPFYLFDIYASERERNQILGYLREYTVLTGNEIMRMFEDFGFPAEDPNPVKYREEIYQDE